MKSKTRYDVDAALDSVESQIAHLQQLTNSAGIVLSPQKVQLLTIYTRQIIIWNSKISLIAHGDISRIALRHLYESLLLTKAVDLTGPKHILDIGTGAGLPGIPLKIWNPQLHLTLLESQRKKIIFLDLISDMLGLKHVHAVCARAEDAVNNTSMQKAFDVVTARAVAPVVQLLEWAEPFLTTDPVHKGICIFPKGSDLNEELKEADKDKWTVSTIDLTPLISNKKQNLIILTSIITNT